MTGPFLVVAALLAVAGAVKVARPAGTSRALGTVGLPASTLLARAVGAVELVAAVAAVGTGSRPAALVVAAAYLAFAAFTIRLIARSGGRADCGCFGQAGAPATNRHVALDLAAAAVAGIAAVAPPGPVASVLSDSPLLGLPLLALVAVGAVAAHAAFTLLLDLDVAAAGGSR